LLFSVSPCLSGGFGFLTIYNQSFSLIKEGYFFAA
jgi:hypothetical protein